MVILDKWYRCDKISPFALGMGNFVLIFEKNAAIGAICSSLGSLQVPGISPIMIDFSILRTPEVA